MSVGRLNTITNSNSDRKLVNTAIGSFVKENSKIRSSIKASVGKKKGCKEVKK